MHTVRTSPYDWRPHSFYALWCSNINILINIEFCYLSVNRFLCHLFICRFLDLWFCFEICAIYWAYKTANGWLLWNPQPDISVPIYWPVWFCSALVNSDTLTAYYGVKQSQFTKPTSEPHASDLKNLMRPLTARLEDGYCSITVANHWLITIIRFVAKSYTYP